MEKIKVGIIGATGYAGVELIRLLLGHPKAEITALCSVSFEGKPISEIYPALYHINDDILVDEDTVIDNCDVIFASVPHGVSEELAVKCLAKGKLLIDLGADFRLHDEADYKEWYKGSYKHPQAHRNAVYSIPEITGDAVKSADVIANPGCYPTSIAIGLAPALKHKLISTKGIVIDSKSGVTGAGRGLTQNTHYPECNEAFAPYKVGTHRHTPEIEQMLSEVAGETLTVTFVPHLLPVNRGIVSTIYADLEKEMSAEKIHKIYENMYKDKEFVRVVKLGDVPNLKNVHYSNYCDVGIFVDTRANKLIVVSTIDNMVKGAAGQAIQNMNLKCGLEEDCGLHLVPPAI